eukprot:m.12228 g.12228  ORF g.12228 m.12228 type:complete len:635 (-) comp4620_c0_seq1:37-1941(-)
MLSLIVVSVLASPTASLYGGWKDAGEALATASVPMHFALRHAAEAEDALHSMFLDVSDPLSSNYGNHLTKEELQKLIPPAPGSVEYTKAWCLEHEFSCDLVGSGDIMKVSASVAAVNSAFGVVMHKFQHDRHPTYILRTLDDFEIPSLLSAHVQAVTGIEQFPNLNFRQVSSGAPQVTPSLLRAANMYNISENASPASKASQALVEFQGQGYLPSDLADFEQKFNLPAQKLRNVNGPGANESAGVEASLDVQYIIATGTGVPTDFYLHAGGEFDVLGWASFVMGQTNPALVWSMSYGEGVNGGNGGVIKPDYVHSFNTQMEQFGVRGLSVLIASGDSGVYNRLPFEDGKFHPSFPACVPAVTAVGGTILNEDGSEDSAWDHSGGGFTPREYYTRANASFQEAAVKAYFSSGVKLPEARKYDNTGRGIPDVSALSVDYAVVTSGQTQGVSGTSASTPTVAGIFSLINDKRQEAGKAPLGFLNPFIYMNPQGFRDIKKGENNEGGLFKEGFQATTGWDPVTGMGTPNYAALKAAAMKSGRRVKTKVTQPEPRCCQTCTDPLKKYFSIVPLLGNCGESCIDPKDYKLYHFFEPNLTLATTPIPCARRGYTNYTHTETHHFGPIHVAVDFFKKNTSQI